jgi:hypothetical protein
MYTGSYKFHPMPVKMVRFLEKKGWWYREGILLLYT